MKFLTEMRECVIDFDFYRQIKGNRFGRSFLYLLLLFLILYSINGAKNFIISRYYIEEAVAEFSETIPEFRLENGEFIFEGKMPYYISSSTSEVFVIDTTGQVDKSVLDSAKTGLLITRDRVHVKRSAAQLQEYNLRELPEGFRLTKAQVVEFLPKLSWILMVLIVFGFVFVLAWKLLNVVLLALLGLISNSAFKAALSYGQLLNISIYALTLPMLLELAYSLVRVTGVYIPYFWVIYWLISILYVTFAVKSCKPDMPDTPDLLQE